MAEFDAEAIQKIADLARVAEPRIVTQNGVPFAVIPEGAHVVSLEQFAFSTHAKQPERIKQTVTVLDPISFIEYYRLFSDEESRVFAYEPQNSVTAILDHHINDGSPRWGQHKLTLAMRHSEEWTRWTGSNNKQMTQQAFAEFLEQNSIDIVDPAPAAMMDVARDLIANTEVEFGSGLRMSDGQVKFKYTETVRASVNGGTVSVPEKFQLMLPVYVGGERVRIDALLRFRVKDGKLSLWYTLIRPEEVLRSAFVAARAAIAAELEITIINGAVA